MNDIKNDITANRYPGVKPFSTEEDFLFFGRETDLAALNSLIFIKQTIILYGKSGYGKSSLINAGIIPKLKENNSWTHFSIRFNNYSEKESRQNLSPSKTTKQRFGEQLTINDDNGFSKLIADEDSFWYWIKLNQWQKKKSNFILFFDQFEELFTYPKEQVTEFSEQLSQLMYNTIPAKFRKRLAELDQSNPVLDELHEFLYEKPDIKVVFSIRSDRLSLVNALTDRHPLILQNCYELDALNIADAAKAIVEPARIAAVLGFETPSFSFTQAAVDKILTSIANPQDGKIEAATLQIVCRYVEDNLVALKKITVIDEAALGDITDIFQQYYQGILNKLPDTERPDAQKLIEDELIDGDKRNPLPADFIKKRFGLTDNLLMQLEQSSLLRKERDAAGRILYEVSHDTLIAAINKVAAGRRAAEEDEKEKMIEQHIEEERKRTRLEEEAKQKRLEQQVQEERKRAQDLTELNEKATFRFKLALGLAIASMCIAAFGFFMWNRATKAEQNEKSLAKTANQALYKNRLLQARDSITKSKIFIKSNDSGYAKTCLTATSVLLTTKIELTEELNKQKLQTENEIDSLLKKCNK